jgi:hypothetical protein
MLVYVVRISPGDRRALLLAVRPSSAPTLG